MTRLRFWLTHSALMVGIPLVVALSLQALPAGPPVERVDARAYRTPTDIAAEAFVATAVSAGVSLVVLVLYAVLSTVLAFAMKRQGRGLAIAHGSSFVACALLATILYARLASLPS